MRRAKIVCTLGPATSSLGQVRALVAAGMDVARLNLSHGSYADHETVYHHVRQAADEAGRGVGILVDLQGPKIRLGSFVDGPQLLHNGARFTITTEDVPGTADLCSTTYDGLPGDASVGDRILIDDGKVTVQVVEVDETRVVTEVIEGGMVSDHKGLNLPGVAVSVPALSEKDVEDLRWALSLQGRSDRAVVRALSATTSSTCTRSWTRRGSGSPSSPRSRSLRRWPTSPRSSRRSTG